MDLAVPSTIFTAPERSEAFRSGSFVLAMSSTCCFVTLPTFSLLGVPEPFGTPAALSSRIAAGGVFVMKEYDLSAYTVTTTGMISPFCEAVFALKFLQKSMMLTPCCPSAGPTGGAGVASPAGICSLTYPVIFFAILLASLARGSGLGTRDSNARARHRSPASFFASLALLIVLSCPVSRVPCPESRPLDLLDLQELKLHRGRAPENRDHDLQGRAVEVDVFDNSSEIREGAVGDPDVFPFFEGVLGLGLLLGGGDPMEDL